MMKATGIVRKVDELGRVVIPIELRRIMNIDVKDGLEIFVDSDRIILKKYEPSCIFTGDTEDLVYFKGKLISRSVINELTQIHNSQKH
ncbi:AbrB/MazE/SpoVT family DNA-binding domain-containing protein [Paenibacillus sp. WLX1005]|uniref:AbrB/MazE/SpoVT family DNA-binding domain-containing protein n=1 Tax=unclassified Paenibacillus TaxID=185978 RepID=UPI0039841235